MSIYATIDVGSNSVLLHVARRLEDGHFVPLIDESTVTRLGEELHRTGKISPNAADRTLRVLERHARTMQANGVRAFVAVGTQCLRQASNSSEFIERVRAATGIPIEVISGEEEARLGYLAAASSLADPDVPVAMIDAGGASTELTFGQGPRIDRKLSLEVGAIRLTDTHVGTDIVRNEDLERLFDRLDQVFARIGPVPLVQIVIAVGGTATTLAAIKHQLRTYDPQQVHGTLLTRKELEDHIQALRTVPLEQRKRIPGMEPGRAEVIVAGASILRAGMRRLNASEIVISDRGLRHALMEERFGR